MGGTNGKHVLTGEDLDYIAAHSALSRQEVDTYYENFLSKHPDGKICRKEFKRMIVSCYPETKESHIDKLEKHIFRMYDTNGDGSIDFREFMVVLYVMSSGTPEENLKQIFRVFDINDDGAISMKEMKRIVKDLYSLFYYADSTTEKEDVVAKMAFKEMDSNADGKVSKEEFVNAVMTQEKFSTMMALKIIDIFVTD